MANRFNFRVWNEENEKMVYPDGNGYLKLENDTVITGNGDLFDLVIQEIVENCILMQSTGLKDKNGKEIFEYDIVVDVNDKTKYKVFYREIGACFSLEFLDSEDFDCRDFGEIQYEGIEQNLEVIGNIFENKELLKKLKE